MTWMTKLSITLTLLTTLSYVLCGGSAATGQLFGFQCPLAGRLPILPGLPAIDPDYIKNLMRYNRYHNGGTTCLTSIIKHLKALSAVD